MRSAFTTAWIIWVSVTLLSFCVIEGIALKAGHGTLSAHIWYLRESNCFLFRLLGSLAVGLVGWLLYHFEIFPDFLHGYSIAPKRDGVIAGALVLLSMITSRRNRES